MSRIVCPKCGSTRYTVANSVRKFSWIKCGVGLLIGFCILGPIGMLIGGFTGLSGKAGDTTFVCQDCGKVFKRRV